MKIFLLVIGAATWLSSGGAYVLLQVRKGDNQSNVDALIHKVVPAGKPPRAADTARKQFDHHKYNAKKYISDGTNQNGQGDRLESIVVAIDSGAPAAGSTGGAGGGGGFDRLVRRLAARLQEGALAAVPRYRAELEKYHIKPEIVHFKSGKPSVMFEINTQGVLRSLQGLLASRGVREYADSVAGQAAMLYRALRDEIAQE